MEMNPDNPAPSEEASNSKLGQPPAQPPQKLTGPSESNQVYVSNGIPPPPNSSSNLGRKPRGRKSKSTQERNIFPPPENQFTQQRPLLPHPMQQSEWAQARLVSPMQQNQRPQPMQHSQWAQTQLITPVQQNRGPQAQFPQLMQQTQSAQAQQQHPTLMMQRVSYYSKLVTEVMHYQWERPQNNTIEFWREFVAKYYDSKAKEMWCLSMCQDHSIPTRKDGRPCSLCGYRPQRGYECGFEVLPKRFKAKFENSRGERLNTGMAQVYRPSPGLTILLYTQATHRSIFGFESVIYKGLLRIAITDQGKILSWEFCVCHREAFVSIKQFPPSENWYGMGGVLGRHEAKNVSDESSEEILQRNNHMTGKPTSVGINNIRTVGSPQVDSMETSLLRNIAGNLQTPRAEEEQLINDNTKCKTHATHTAGRSSHALGNGETRLIPNPGMEFQIQEMHPASAQPRPTVTNLSQGVYITDATVMEGVGDDIERYLIDNPAGQFLTQEMQVINHLPRQ